MRGIMAIVVAQCCLPGMAGGAEGNGVVQVWSVEPLIKVFRDAVPGKRDKPEAEADVARGEYASLQIVVRADVGIEGLRAEVGPLTMRLGKATLEPRAPRFVGYVPVDRPTQTPSKDQLREPPADYPDPLLEVDQIDVGAGEAQPIWVTVPVPVDAKPGRYRGRLSVTAAVGGVQVSADARLSVRVYKAVVKDTRLWVTEWYSMHWRHMAISPEAESDAYYALLERYARNMAEHRHNVALISPLGLAQFTANDAGTLDVDFSRFDKWVGIFKEAGVIGRIEGGHIGGRKAGWDSEFVVTVHEVKDGKVASARVDPSSPEADLFYAQFFPALVSHLRDKGWLEIYMQHLADEPIAGNIESYRAMARLARTYASDLPIIEACHTKDLVGAIDVWVPQLNYLDRDYDHYLARQKEGEEVWFYTCVFPQGDYANRFIELPLIKTRLLHWINYRYGATGYLHWGYNHWTGDSPFTHTTRPHGGPDYLPAGDPWIVYPGKNGPLDSIRFEAMRDGIDDHELLSMLGERDLDTARELAAQHVLEFCKYNTDVEAFRKTRRKLLKRLSRR